MMPVENRAIDRALGDNDACFNRVVEQVNIWVDADACPVVIREILCKAAMRTGVKLTLVANHRLPVPRTPQIRMLQVASGYDAADTEIVQRVQAGDLVVTADIPLAAEVIGKDGLVLSPRGERFTADNIGARLNMRDFLESMRSSGVETGGPPALDQTDRKAFADQLDRLLTRYRSEHRSG